MQMACRGETRGGSRVASRARLEPHGFAGSYFREGRSGPQLEETIMADPTTDPTGPSARRHDEMVNEIAPGGSARLISSDRVEGTAVFDPSGNRLGSIEALMIDKVRGVVEYAVLSFGGFLGIGSSHYPLPWDQLRYDIGLGGYVADVSAEQLQQAPSFRREEAVDWSDQQWGERVRGFYGPSPYGSRDDA